MPAKMKRKKALESRLSENPSAAVSSDQKVLQPIVRSGPARSEQDWINQEKSEPVKVRNGDIMDDLMGTPWKYQNYSQTQFRLKDGSRFSVDRYYFHKKIALDHLPPEKEKEIKEREQCLKALGIKYLAWVHGRPMPVRSVTALVN